MLTAYNFQEEVKDKAFMGYGKSSICIQPRNKWWWPEESVLTNLMRWRKPNSIIGTKVVSAIFTTVLSLKLVS